MDEQGARFFVLAVVLYCLSLFPAILQHTADVGFDGPIYWHTARGEPWVVHPKNGPDRLEWIYSDRLRPALSYLGGLSYPVFLGLLHLGNVAGLGVVLSSLLRHRQTYPLIVWGACIFLATVASDALASSNVHVALCGLALSPWGAFAAAAVKPQFMLAVVLHAAMGAYRIPARIRVDGEPQGSVLFPGDAAGPGDARRAQ